MKRITHIYCVILCGGKSLRMGRDKALLPFCGKSLVEFQFQKMQKIFSHVYLASKTPYHGLPALLDESHLFTPLIGIQNALQKLPCQKVFFICVDTPLIPPEIINSLLELSLQTTAQITYIQTPQKNHYLTSIWDKSTLKAIQNALNSQEFALKNLIHACKSQVLSYNNEKDFSNLNTPEEYESILRG
ncbi:molybdopterin-guanine dinucleotide biosynthesis protein A [Helicobacter mustelae]|uniref:NTP transferase domain-containing protein n=1 Tax=Helicobacter mustelae TaxID=217 RepID=UPI000E01B463|nr:NTP transferase domain-containing protein [Helicobacter mustelae]STP12503.1 molybdopterin-guanine dinucleotide biosynthesis protein A [Helicobacter mustelae]